MAILNEWAIMGPNYLMLVLGIIGAICGFVMFYVSTEVISTYRVCLRSFVFVLAMVLIGISIPTTFIYDSPEFEIPSGKKYIEATFANGAPTAAILQKYDVIDMDGKVYTLREKDGVKDEKRAKVRIGEEK